LDKDPGVTPKTLKHTLKKKQGNGGERSQSALILTFEGIRPK
jgi:hypothetical protein